MKQTKKALAIIQILAAAIKESRAIPSGHLYAKVMSKISFGDYAAAIETLERAKIITVGNNHLLSWNA